MQTQSEGLNLYYTYAMNTLHIWKDNDVLSCVDVGL